ncbi:hypothetical protein Q8A73_017663 [Channa argus]|nr:hypothetical protein Q8A73_017663 [Channa argus]
MQRRKVDILCVQGTRWKGSKARSLGAGFKLFYHGSDRWRNGVGVILKEELVRNVLEVIRVSDRLMSLKLEIEVVMFNVVSGYAPQVGCELEEKEKLDEVMQSILRGERVVIGADFNGDVGEGNRGDENVMGRFGLQDRNTEGQMVVDFAKRMEMAVVNTFFQKRQEHRVTYKSGGRNTQVDDILCRRVTVRSQGAEVKKMQDFKYLGSMVQSNGECGKEVKRRVQAGWNSRSSSAPCVSLLSPPAGPKLRPSVSLLPPLSRQISGGSATLACLLTGYSPQGAVVSWEVDGTEVTEGVLSSSEEENNGRFSSSSTLTLNQENWMRGEVYSCRVLHHDHSEIQSLRRSHCET